MKKSTTLTYIFLASVLILPSMLNAVESIWELWNGTREEYKIYLLKDSIEYGTTVGSAWFMVDFKTPQTLTYRNPQGVVTKTVEYNSYRYILIFDCDELSTRHKEIKYYTKNMGTGTVVNTDYGPHGFGLAATTHSTEEWLNYDPERFCGKTWKVWKFIN